MDKENIRYISTSWGPGRDGDWTIHNFPVPISETRDIDILSMLAKELNVTRRTTEEARRPADGSTRYIDGRLCVLETAARLGWQSWRCGWMQPAEERDDEVSDNPWVALPVRNLIAEAKRLRAKVQELEAKLPKVNVSLHTPEMEAQARRPRKHLKCRKRSRR